MKKHAAIGRMRVLTVLIGVTAVVISSGCGSSTPVSAPPSPSGSLRDSPRVTQPTSPPDTTATSGPCRSGSAAGATQLATIAAAVAPFLGTGTEPNGSMTTTPGLSLAFVAPDNAQSGVPQFAIVNCGVTAAGGSAPTTNDTVYEIGSQSKAFTATALAQLVQNGSAQLSDTLASRLTPATTVPSTPCGNSSAGAQMTLQNLATHNAGLREDPANITWGVEHPEGHRIYDRDDLSQSFSSTGCATLKSVPGTAWSYSNWGFALLGEVLADAYAPNAGGIPNYAKLVGDLVTGPLGLTHTVVETNAGAGNAALPTCPNSIERNFTNPVPCFWANSNAFAGGGGLVSTITDMARFTAANLGFYRDSLVAPAIAMTHQRFGIGQACPTCQGLAWQIIPRGAPASVTPFEILEKDGGTWGMFSHTFFAPGGCWGVTLLSNGTSGAVVTQMAQAVMRQLGQQNRCSESASTG